MSTKLTARKTAPKNRRPKMTAEMRAWLSANGRLGGIATNNKRAKEKARAA